ncbi:zinc ribbon domain-containing protein [Streptomyces sp. NPDC086080]|uniref:zinc ribbon domain-containing protein n=1 Tax=Streptomyces sp. NPDC086080 TaxID=3365748 RepID=UPI0037D413FF
MPPPRRAPHRPRTAPAPGPPSPACPDCGHIAKENRATQAKFECTTCGFLANANDVGSLNVLSRAGLVLCDGAWPPTQEARRFGGGWSHLRKSVSRPEGRGSTARRGIAVGVIARPC